MSREKSFLTRIPKVDALLREPALIHLRETLSHETLVGIIRDVLAEIRRRFLAGDLPPEDLAGPQIVARVVAHAADLVRAPLRKVINATGILIHTNLGRAPLPAGAQRAVAGVLGGYSNLEIDLATGRRTSRLGRVTDLLKRVTGAEDALAVNNNAAAVFLALHVLSAGREVVVSRGELVEIGGSFRLPDIMEASGAVLREVGTTNRTRIGDYARATTERTGLLFKVHPSNFVIEGFSESVENIALAELGREHGVPLLVDLGSGALNQHPREFLREEPRVQETLRHGADLVSFSGDKLLGGPQAGIILGRSDLIGRLRCHPLARVVRLDKLHLAALEATLCDYLRGEAGVTRIPLYRMMARGLDELRDLGEEICSLLVGTVSEMYTVGLVDTNAAAGGGSLPGETLPSVGIEITCEGRSVDALARLLRVGVPSVLGRIERDRLILDLRTVTEEDWVLLPDLLAARLGEFAEQAGQGGE
jgi:L-seryl-tRNA(Ser) seleniumtransferase